MKRTEFILDQRVRVFFRFREKGTITHAGLARCGYQPTTHEIERQKVRAGRTWLRALMRDPDWAA